MSFCTHGQKFFWIEKSETAGGEFPPSPAIKAHPGFTQRSGAGAVARIAARREKRHLGPKRVGAGSHARSDKCIKLSRDGIDAERPLCENDPSD